MRDFIMAALPWVCMGLGVAVSLAVLNEDKTKAEAAGEDKAAAAQRSRGLVKGICIGECIGIAASSALQVSMAYGIGLGMLVGVLLGKLINGRKQA